MKFFTAHDVLSYTTAATPDDPVTIHLDDTIQAALAVMLENDFDQLPVVSDDRVEGIITYKSVAKYVKAMDDPRLDETSVKIALNTHPVFVDLDHDIFDLFDTLTKDDYVLLGDSCSRTTSRPAT